MPTTSKIQRIHWRAERDALPSPFDRIVFDNKWIGGVPRGLILMAYEEEDRVAEGLATFLVGYCDDTGDERMLASWAYVDATSEAEAEGIVYGWHGTHVVKAVALTTRLANAREKAEARAFYVTNANSHVAVDSNMSQS